MRSLSKKRGAAAQQYAIVVGLIAVIAIAATVATGQSIKTLFTSTGNTLTTVVNGTVGAAPPPPVPSDSTPDAFSFTDLNGQLASTAVSSNILAITGIDTTAAITITGGQYRTCNDASCTSVIQAFTSTAGNIAPGKYLQLQVTSSGSAGATVTATVTVGGVSDSWQVITNAGPWNFTSCGQSANTTPSQGNCDTAYASSSLAGAVTVSSGMQLWTVPATGNYSIRAVGGSGGYPTSFSYRGGTGADITGTVALTAGQQLLILVGQAGSSRPYSGAGGGGTFVTLGNSYATSTPLIVAGGGGGANNSSYPANGTGGCSSTSGCGGQAGTNGINGNGGYANNDGHCGAGNGFYTNQQDSAACSYGSGGTGFRNGGAGATYTGCNTNYNALGGFGGGGNPGCSYGSGGGGYSGGRILGGGGSFNSGTNQTNTAGVTGGSGTSPANGYVTITQVP